MNSRLESSAGLDIWGCYWIKWLKGRDEMVRNGEREILKKKNKNKKKEKKEKKGGTYTGGKTFVTRSPFVPIGAPSCH